MRPPPGGTSDIQNRRACGEIKIKRRPGDPAGDVGNRGPALSGQEPLSDVSKIDPEYKKKHVATMANLEAAIICNHKRKPRKNWEESLAKKKERLKKLRAKKTTSAKKRAKILLYKIKAFRETRDYNLGTSLKSYIDPRIYHRWGRRVDFDWKLFYPKALQKKFSWVEREIS